MQERLASISVKADLPVFATLTLPDSYLPAHYQGFDYQYRILCDDAHSLLDVWLKRLHRAVPNAAVIWKMEAQRRKSGAYEGKYVPHFHAMIWHWPDGQGLSSDGSPGGGELPLFARDALGVEKFVCLYYAGKCWGQLELFRQWVALSWYQVVGTGDVSHWKAGTRVELVRTFRGVTSYCSKYLAKVDEVGQPTVYGRCWGISNRKCIPWAQLVSLDLSGEVGYRLRRVMHRYLEKQMGRRYALRNGCGLTLFCDAENWWVKLVRASQPDPF